MEGNKCTEKPENVPSGTCEEIDLGNFSGDPKCIPAPQTWLIRSLRKKFPHAGSAEITNLNFFTRSCPRVSRVSILLRKGMRTRHRVSVRKFVNRVAFR